MPLDPELLASLSDQEIVDLAVNRPRAYEALVNASPQVKLHDMIWKSGKKVKDLKLDPEMSLREVEEEMGVALAPDSTIARTRRHARTEIEPLVEEVRDLRKKLDARDKQTEEADFDASLKRYAAENDAEISDEEVGEIKTFMQENQYGPKAAKAAVTAWLETKAPAEPNLETESALTWNLGNDEHAKALEKLGPGDDLGPNTPRGIRHAEKVWSEMYGKQGNRPRFVA